MKKKLGWTIFVSSFVFLGLGIWVISYQSSSAWMIGLATALAILAEVTFWVGGAMVGIGWIKRWKERKKNKS
ncbi:MAG: hypothetical protein RLZZ267_262 [Bacillota bacterium]|jgi:hypothetical protein